MIFGSVKKRKPSQRMIPKRVYAWHPVVLIDGRWAWLVDVERVSYFHDDVPPNASMMWLSFWCYRLPIDAPR